MYREAVFLAEFLGYRYSWVGRRRGYCYRVAVEDSQWARGGKLRAPVRRVRPVGT